MHLLKLSCSSCCTSNFIANISSLQFKWWLFAWLNGFGLNQKGNDGSNDSAFGSVKELSILSPFSDPPLSERGGHVQVPVADSASRSTGVGVGFGS